MQTSKAVLRAAALTTAAVGLALTTATSASATTVADSGLAPNSSVDFHGCRANVHFGNDTAAGHKGYARGIIDAPTVDDRGYACEGWLQRKIDGGAWYRISDVYSGGAYSTAWYFNNAPDGYHARVCVADLSGNPDSVSCGGDVVTDPKP